MSWFDKQKEHFDKTFKLHYLLTLEYTRSNNLNGTGMSWILMDKKNHEITIIFDKIIFEFDGKHIVDEGYHTGQLTDEFIVFFNEMILKLDVCGIEL